MTPNQSSALTLESSSTRPQAEGSSPLSRDTIHRWAGTAHEAIDKLEQRLSSAGGSSGSGGTMSSVMAAPRAYGEQARQYQQQLNHRVQDKPLQTAGAVFAAGVVLGKLFKRREKVKVVRVYGPSRTEAAASGVRARAHEWREAASTAARRLGESGQHKAHQAGAVTLAGLATAKAASSRLWDQTRRVLPQDLASTRRQAVAKSQYYGLQARDQLERHPMPGLAVALGIGAVASALALGRSRDTSDRSVPVVRAVDKEGTPFRSSDWRDTDGRGVAALASPIASGALALGVGVVIGALLMRNR